MKTIKKKHIQEKSSASNKQISTLFQHFNMLSSITIESFYVLDIYRRNYLHKIQTRFEEGIMHEDELWCPVVLCQAEKIIISDIGFYYYRQNVESVMHTTGLLRRLKSLFCVTDRLVKYADLYNFSEENRELTSWWYVNIFRLYSMAFRLLSQVKDSSYIVPKHHLDRFWRGCELMIPDSLQRCRDYYCNAEAGLKKYIDWRMSDWVAPIDFQIKAGKKLALIYNMIYSEDLLPRIEDIPIDWVITTDRKYFQQAALIVFHLPGLYQELETDLDKQEGQMWISWFLESEKNDPLINDPEIKDVFDLSISYCKDNEQKEHPLIYLCRNYPIIDP
ncbi:hypothetical protein [Parabacteroides chinchillae]